MSAKKQIIIVCMVAIIAAVCMIFVIFSGNEPASDNSLDEAQKYLDNMDYDHAIAIYNDILRNDKQSANAYLGLAEAYLKKGNENKAIEILERGLPYSGNNMRFYNMLSKLTEKEYSAEAEDNFPDRNTDTEGTFPEVQHTEETVSESELEITAPETASDTEAAVTETSAPAVVEEQTTATASAAPEIIVPETTTAYIPAASVTETTAAEAAETIVEVPDFTGMNKNDAVSLADSLNIKLDLEYKESSKYENDVIYSQSKKAGAKVSEQTSIRVYVAVNNQPSEEELKLQAFFSAAETWGELNSSQIKSVKLNERTSTVTVSLSSIKRLIVDSSVMEAFAECENAVMVINSSAVSVSINSSSVTKAGKLDLSTSIYGNESRTNIEIGASGSLNCTASVTVLDCNTSASDLENMNLYYNNKKVGKISVNTDGKPVMTIDSGGQYVIR